MSLRRPQALGVLVALVLSMIAVPAVTAAAAPAGSSPQLSVKWVEGPTSPFDASRFDGQYVPSMGRIYFLGFRTDGDLTSGEVWYFDVASKTYVDTGVAMPVPVTNYGIAMLKDPNGVGLYIFGGRDANGNIVTDTQVYYPATNTAVDVSTDPWPGTTPSDCVSLPAMGTAVLKNRAIVMGGLSFSANGCVDDQSAQTWIFNPMAAAGARWKQGPSLNVARGYITPAVYNGAIFAIGGDTNSAGTLIPVATVEAWKPPKGGWNDSAVADLPQACDESQAFGLTAGPLAGNVVLAGCGQWPNGTGDTFAYDVATNTWSDIGVLADVVRNQAGALVPTGGSQVMYLLGGYDESSGFLNPVNVSQAGLGQAAAGSSPAAASRASIPAARGAASTF